MRTYSLLLFFISIVTFSSCSGKQNNGSENSIQKRYVVSADADHSYEVYLPSGYDSTKTYPAIFSFDSHGNGSVAIANFKKAADTYGFILVGSNLIRNGINDYEKHISLLIDDAKNRFKIDARAMYTAGFSGGARMANYYGLKNQLTGIISCGAGFKVADIKSTGVSLYVFNIAGTRDCNFGETAYLPGSNECHENNYITTNFTGIHEWPTISAMSEAVAFMYARLVIDKIRDAGSVSISDLVDEKKTEIDSLKKTNNKIALYKKLETAAKMFAGTSDGTEFESQMKSIEEDKAFIESLNSKEQILQMEGMLDQGYVGAMGSESLTWWTTELKALNDSLQNGKNPDMKDMMFRAKAYIGMACFSFTGNAAKKKDIPQLEKMLTIYQMVEPKNPDVFYYKSLYCLLKNQKDSVFANMKKAYELGFEDSVRVRADFPAEMVSQIIQLAPQHR